VAYSDITPYWGYSRVGGDTTERSLYKNPPIIVGCKIFFSGGFSMTFRYFGLLFCTVLGTSAAQVGQNAPKAPDVQVLLALRSSSVCLRTPELIADLVLVNKEAVPRQFDLNDLNVISAFSAMIDTSTMQYRNEGLSVMGDRMGPKLHPTMATLTPRGAFTKTLSFSLKNEFFDKAGFYLLMPSISIGKIKRPSNPTTGIIFEIRDCD
jgi:hypothetical protein